MSKAYAEPVPGYMDHPRVDLLPGPFGKAPYQVAERPLHYWSRVADRWITIPKGYRSDLLSVPLFFIRLIPRGGWGKRASIVHDWLCDERPAWSSSDLAADIFAEALELDQVPAWRRKAMVWAVRHFGPQWETLKRR